MSTTAHDLSTDYLQIATDAAKRFRHELLADGDRAPYTIVEGRIGSTSHARAFADVFDTAGHLTVSSVDNPEIQSVHQAGTWKAAHVYGIDGHLLYSVTAPVAVDPLGRRCEQCGAWAYFTGRQADGVDAYECAAGHRHLTVPGTSRRGAA